MASSPILLLLLSALLLPSTSYTFASPLQQRQEQQQHQSGGVQHIVLVDKDHPAPPNVEELLDRLALNVDHPDVAHVYNNSAFHGFAASMKSHCLDLLANMSDVSIVEETIDVSHALVLSRDAVSPSSANQRQSAPWGLQQISSSSLVTGSSSALDYTYSYPDASLGQGADVYIIDTGVYTAHNVFQGRASMIWTFESSGDASDDEGHGTHVAGTAAGAILGVASQASIFGVKALDSKGGGSSATVIAGLDAVITHHDARASSAGAVINISLAASGIVAALDTAISAAVAAGVHVVVAAGNSHQDACTASPSSSGGSHGPAIAVGALDISAHPASFSNYGTCVDVYAPGVDIVSAWPGQPNLVNTLSGTSMATPHVVGLIACMLATNASLARDPAAMKRAVAATALNVPGQSSLLLVNNGVRNSGALAVKRSDERLSSSQADVTGARPWVFADVESNASDVPSAMAAATATGRSMMKRTFSAMDVSGWCRRDLGSAADDSKRASSLSSMLVGAWLCNAKRALFA